MRRPFGGTAQRGAPVPRRSSLAAPARRPRRAADRRADARGAAGGRRRSSRSSTATVSEPDGWVRLRGRIVPLTESPTGEPGRYALLVDAANPLQAIVVRSDGPIRSSRSRQRDHRPPHRCDRRRRGGAAARGNGLRRTAARSSRPDRAARRGRDAGARRPGGRSRSCRCSSRSRADRRRRGRLSGLPAHERGRCRLVAARAGRADPGRVRRAASGRTVRDLADPARRCSSSAAGRAATCSPPSRWRTTGGRHPRRCRSAGLDERRDRQVYTVRGGVPALRLRAEQVDATFLLREARRARPGRCACGRRPLTPDGSGEPHHHDRRDVGDQQQPTHDEVEVDVRAHDRHEGVRAVVVRVAAPRGRGRGSARRRARSGSARAADRPTTPATMIAERNQARRRGSRSDHLGREAASAASACRPRASLRRSGISFTNRISAIRMPGTSESTSGSDVDPPV